MKKSEAYLGTGITKLRRETTQAETSEDVMQLLHEISYSGTHRFEVFLDELASDCRTELRKKGLPVEWKIVVRDLKNDEYDSVVGYAARLLRTIGSLKSHLANGKADADALHKAYQLGALHLEARFKSKHEKAAITGAKVRAGSKEGPLARDAQQAPRLKRRNIAMARAFLERREARSGISDSALKKDIGGKCKPPLSRSQSIQAIDAGLKILSCKPGKPDG